MSSDSTNADPVVSVRGLGKCYQVYARPQDRLKQALWRGRRRYYKEFWALQDVSFDVRRGEALGIIGRNGSGKSTLLQLIAGTLAPTVGEARVRGRVAALLELGSGFNPDFTGRENVYMNGAILGLSRREIDERFNAITAFADIGEFVDRPVKTYSSGMVVRLAFSVQVQVEPDVLIIDEALAVGDSLFQKRCFQRMEDLRRRGVTLLFVSHDQESIRTLTSQAVLLDEGRVKAYGPSAEAILEYRRLLHDEEKKYIGSQIDRLAPKRQAQVATQAPVAREGLRSRALSFGDLDAQIVGVDVLDAQGEKASVFYPGDRLVMRVHARMNRDLTRLNVAVRIRNKEGVKIYSWGTFNQDMAIWNGAASGEVFWERRFHRGETVTVEFDCDCVLGANFYEVQAAIAEEQERFYGSQRIVHWQDEAAFFQVCLARDTYFFGGTCDLRAKARVVPEQATKAAANAATS